MSQDQTSSATRPRPVLLAIFDGWGHSDAIEHNAIQAADTPQWDRLRKQHPLTTVDTSGISVGLPSGQMGNSEVGHLNLGAGRVIYQEITRISKAIEDGEFERNRELLNAITAAKESKGALHLAGLLSPGGVHSLDEHLFAMVRLAAKHGVNCYVHAILDGRDMPPRSARETLEKLDTLFAELRSDHFDGGIASLVGRYFAMDRDQRWERVEKAYRLIADGKAEFAAETAVAGLDAAYDRDENDEFVQPTTIGAAPRHLADGDAVIFMNFRADRAREITQALALDDFEGFNRGDRPRLSSYVCLTEYRADFGLPVAFPPVRPRNVLGEYVSDLGLKQLRIAETEKYAHVTFFFNGGEEKPFPGEDRELIPSPKVATYDLQPEMAAPELTELLVGAIESGKYDLIICNYANADMVGHTGNFDAAVKAIEALDTCLGRVANAIEAAGGEMLMTADHGNAEQMYDPATGQAHTAHTTNLVPLLYLGRPASLVEGGALSDLAPTLLTLMGQAIPPEMTGTSLVKLDS
ncbi:MAG: 2,3-bisphosphoglycerate-independent phosphoglycerate mutase [Gammaproteobacteria bacterium]|nr:2,3-bisphosphoglycerate-independent phosphoglycerate mutase [Gammaproteobacteria bacterium]